MRLLHNLVISILAWTLKHRREYRFRKWIVLEDKKEKIIEAVGNRQPEFPDRIFDYISTALGVSSKWYDKADWYRVVILFYVCLGKAPHINLPLTSPNPKKESTQEEWTYEGRSWHVYSHMLASAYGWTLEYISQLQVREALAKIQEILADQQLEHEFFYGLSEVAYEYDHKSGVGHLRPMERPYWMLPSLKKIPRFEIPKSMLPAGVVEMSNVLPDEYLPKEIQTKAS